MRHFMSTRHFREQCLGLSPPKSRHCRQGRPVRTLSYVSSRSRYSGSSPLLNYEEVAAIAKTRGLDLELKTLGPFYRIQCLDEKDKGKVLGTTNGFIVPLFKLMHCDTMQIFLRGKGGEEGDRLRGGILGLGYLLATAVFAHGYWNGCRKAEILAINDNERTHARLKKYYRRMFGFQEVVEVGDNGLRDLPHLLVWGGAGTRMDGDIETMLRKCCKTLEAKLT